MSDDIRRWSDELARDPSSLVFLQLGEALRRSGQLELALRVALRGLERHSHSADAHDLLARIAVDRGELERAHDEWDMVLRLSPSHGGALRGLGFVCYRQGRIEDAARYLAVAAARAPDDHSTAAALAHVRAQLAPAGAMAPRETTAPAAAAADLLSEESVAAAERMSRALSVALEEVWVDAAGEARANGSATAALVAAPGAGPAAEHATRSLFDDALATGARAALLLDASGLVLAGAYPAGDGTDLAQEVGAELSGVRDEAERAMRHLALGEWRSIVFETSDATVAMAPVARDALVLVAAPRETPLGYVARTLARAAERACAWLEGAQ